MANPDPPRPPQDPPGPDQIIGAPKVEDVDEIFAPSVTAVATIAPALHVEDDVSRYVPRDRLGRNPLDDAAEIAALRAFLASYLQTEKEAGRKPKQQDECIELALGEAQRRGYHMSRDRVLTKVVFPEHHLLWPPLAE